MAPSKDSRDLESLASTVATISSLITQLQSSATPATSTSTPPGGVAPLELAHDTASLIRAHSTKLSLLIINKPFTPSAVTKVLRELIAGPLPGLASAVELCTPNKYSKTLSKELQYRAGRVFAELGTLVAAIPLDGQILSDDAKNGVGAGNGKGSLAMTGTVWAACDSVIELKGLGIAGLVVRKAEEYRSLLKDALEELQEWGEEESDTDENVNSEDEDVDEAQAAVDNIFGSQRHIPTEDPQRIRPKLESSLKRIRLLSLMYQAVIKRRFKTLPPLPQLEAPADSEEVQGVLEVPGISNSLDEVLAVMNKIPSTVDELASSFYELDAKDIDKNMDSCSLHGFEIVELLMKNWTGQEDEFSNWARKFQTEMKRSQ